MYRLVRWLFALVGCLIVLVDVIGFRCWLFAPLPSLMVLVDVIGFRCWLVAPLPSLMVLVDVIGFRQLAVAPFGYTSLAGVAPVAALAAAGLRAVRLLGVHVAENVQPFGRQPFFGTDRDAMSRSSYLRTGQHHRLSRTHLLGCRMAWIDQEVHSQQRLLVT